MGAYQAYGALATYAASVIGPLSEGVAQGLLLATGCAAGALGLKFTPNPNA